MFVEGIFPETLKISHLTAIHEKDDPDSPSNHKPITLLHYMSVIHGSCASRLTSICDKFHIISSTQFGSQKGKSTRDAVLNKALNDKTTISRSCST